jgi:phage baseplate assembly protein W
MASITSRAKDYSDLDLDFTVHPVTKDVVKKIGPNAVARSIRNLVLTNFYERPFRSFIGSNAQKMLFENINPITANVLQDQIRDVILSFEPRATISTISVTPDIDNNGYTARIVFTVNNRPEPYTTTIFLERIR